ncbi:sulfate/molybdate ABC transporter ATP-binding protein [Reinekea marinisedimentorum]|uniref:Sulfate transport system ATP-binding protein n=1 Tax=Reinekea marinisedimentorum TaxID=230495 RepID=A0A4R3I1E3_9GAMM|nr:TOBE-like domain-containing protein [Reinekea marinisedimentorum]TCS39024.1 sulfate transport system ATP-binding protein [Reinekea marinisedimentorum]
MSIRIENIAKVFGGFQALSPLNLEVEKGEMIGLLGPSGSGKTTLLRIIAGLEGADAGRIYFHDRDVTHVHARDRRVGFVFQNYALFRHMTVAENVAFGLDVLDKKQRPNRQEIKARVAQLLETVQLSHLAKRYPQQLSGGQKQRIALARALATKPEVLLLDEPFGALDAKVRKELRRWLRSLHDELGFTSIFVTHDQDEALELSDRVVVMSNGKIEQVDDPVQLYAKPASQFVFDFLGNVNVLDVNYSAGKWTNGEAFLTPPHEDSPTQNGKLFIRSHELSLSALKNNTASLPVDIISINPVGSDVRVDVQPVGWGDGKIWECKLSHSELRHLALERGARVYAAPRVAYFFAEGNSADPVVIHWPFIKEQALDFTI